MYLNDLFCNFISGFFFSDKIHKTHLSTLEENLRKKVKKKKKNGISF